MYLSLDHAHQYFLLFVSYDVAQFVDDFRQFELFLCRSLCRSVLFYDGGDFNTNDKGHDSNDQIDVDLISSE